MLISWILLLQICTCRLFVGQFGEVFHWTLVSYFVFFIGRLPLFLFLGKSSFQWPVWIRTSDVALLLDFHMRFLRDLIGGFNQ